MMTVSQSGPPFHASTLHDDARTDRHVRMMMKMLLGVPTGPGERIFKGLKKTKSTLRALQDTATYTQNVPSPYHKVYPNLYINPFMTTYIIIAVLYVMMS